LTVQQPIDCQPQEATVIMVFPQVPLMSFDQMIEDKARALELTPKHEQLPPYSEATKDRFPVKVSEKEVSQKPRSKASSTMSTLKSILTGDVHKHNPRYVLEESITGQPSAARSKR